MNSRLSCTGFPEPRGLPRADKRCAANAGTGQVESWNIATRGLVKQFDKPPRKPPGHFYMLSVAVSPDGRKAASTHSDGGIAVYEIATGQLLADFNGHRDSVIGIAWAGSDRVLSAGGDHQVLVWDVSLAALAGKADPIKSADRNRGLGEARHLDAKEATKVMAALASDPKGTTAMLAERLKPVAVANPAALDRIFRELDDKAFAVRERASRELVGWGLVRSQVFGSE